jgi:hypothetical protein
MWTFLTEDVCYKEFFQCCKHISVNRKTLKCRRKWEDILDVLIYFVAKVTEVYLSWRDLLHTMLLFATYILVSKTLQLFLLHFAKFNITIENDILQNDARISDKLLRTHKNITFWIIIILQRMWKGLSNGLSSEFLVFSFAGNVLQDLEAQIVTLRALPTGPSNHEGLQLEVRRASLWQISWLIVISGSPKLAASFSYWLSYSTAYMNEFFHDYLKVRNDKG